MDDRQARECVARIEALLEEVEGLPAAVELVQGLLDLYGEGLGRIVASDPTLVARLDGDEVVTHLLLLHGLHPVPLEERVVGALDEVRPYLASHGGGVELLGVEEGVVRLRLQGSCDAEARDRGRDPQGGARRRGRGGRGHAEACAGAPADRDAVVGGRRRDRRSAGRRADGHGGGRPRARVRAPGTGGLRLRPRVRRLRR
jgi:hypothetical protein